MANGMSTEIVGPGSPTSFLEHADRRRAEAVERRHQSVLQEIGHALLLRAVAQGVFEPDVVERRGSRHGWFLLTRRSGRARQG